MKTSHLEEWRMHLSLLREGHFAFRSTGARRMSQEQTGKSAHSYGHHFRISRLRIHSSHRAGQVEAGIPVSLDKAADLLAAFVVRLSRDEDFTP